MGLRLCQKVWEDLFKQGLNDGIKGHAKDLVLNSLVEKLIIYGSLSKEVGYGAEINWDLIRIFLKFIGIKLLI